MKKHPFQLESKDLIELKHKRLLIEVGSINENTKTSTYEGEIISSEGAVNPPHLPVTFKFRTDEGEIKSFSIFELKDYKLI
jgi:hypothetical protein